MSDPLEYQLPCTEALLAGTLALMTGHAEAACDHAREAMANKIVANLDELLSHACLSSQFQHVLQVLQSHWRTLHEREIPAQRADDELASAAQRHLH
ncbi:hypothetical protein [Ramlibacter sp.]|uniref:hypothetical protein n=1 Tax=Ramlibacter sp. TaxID=1917967 RepID=UPI003D108C2F